MRNEWQRRWVTSVLYMNLMREFVFLYECRKLRSEIVRRLNEWHTMQCSCDVRHINWLQMSNTVRVVISVYTLISVDRYFSHIICYFLYNYCAHRLQWGICEERFNSAQHSLPLGIENWEKEENKRITIQFITFISYTSISSNVLCLSWVILLFHCKNSLSLIVVSFFVILSSANFSLNILMFSHCYRIP